jgi:UDP-N-acetylglucosamine:LPS N-acetylglucosamine transferase
LFREIKELASHPEILENMSERARTFAKPGAARRAAEVLEEAAGIRSEAG